MDVRPHDLGHLPQGIKWASESWFVGKAAQSYSTAFMMFHANLPIVIFVIAHTHYVIMCIMCIHSQKGAKPSGSFNSFKSIYWQLQYKQTAQLYHYLSKATGCHLSPKVMNIEVTQVHAELHTFAPKNHDSVPHPWFLIVKLLTPSKYHSTIPASSKIILRSGKSCSSSGVPSTTSPTKPLSCCAS